MAYVVGQTVKTTYGALKIVKVNKTSVVCDLQNGTKIKILNRQLDIMNS